MGLYSARHGRMPAPRGRELGVALCKIRSVVPAKAGIHLSTWNKFLYGSPGKRGRSPGRHPPTACQCTSVMPAKAGIHGSKKHRSRMGLAWVPAFAGTTPRFRCRRRMYNRAEQLPGLLPLLRSPLPAGPALRPRMPLMAVLMPREPDHGVLRRRNRWPGRDERALDHRDRQAKRARRLDLGDGCGQPPAFLARTTSMRCSRNNRMSSSAVNGPRA